MRNNTSKEEVMELTLLQVVLYYRSRISFVRNANNAFTLIVLIFCLLVFFEPFDFTVWSQLKNTGLVLLVLVAISHLICRITLENPYSRKMIKATSLLGSLVTAMRSENGVVYSQLEKQLEKLSQDANRFRNLRRFCKIVVMRKKKGLSNLKPLSFMQKLTMNIIP